MDAWQACVLMNDFLPMASVVYDDLPILVCKDTKKITIFHKIKEKICIFCSKFTLVWRFELSKFV